MEHVLLNLSRFVKDNHTECAFCSKTYNELASNTVAVTTPTLIFFKDSYNFLDVSRFSQIISWRFQGSLKAVGVMEAKSRLIVWPQCRSILDSPEPGANLLGLHTPLMLLVRIWLLAPLLESLASLGRIFMGVLS